MITTATDFEIICTKMYTKEGYMYIANILVKTSSNHSQIPIWDGATSIQLRTVY